VVQVTAAFTGYEYAQAKNEIESFFWRDLTDNYLEMAKLRLYDPAHTAHSGARQALKTGLLTLLKLLAPLLPYVTDAIWRAIFADEEGISSIHLSSWPEGNGTDENKAEAELGDLLIAIASAARRYKSENSLSLGSQLARLQIATREAGLSCILQEAEADLTSVTRARTVEVVQALDPHLIRLNLEGGLVEAGIEP
jgi:valyl-tRNA synthetase